jgi:branched-chain amino acid transport system ATP-binding protein
MLRLQDIRARYGGLDVLRGVSLVVPPGATVGLLGANGAGKTTLLRVAAGLMPATGGGVFLAGRRADHDRPHVRAQHGMCLVPDGRGIFPGLTVAENIEMFVGGRMREQAAAEAAELFPVLGERLDQTADTMSGGEQQMLALSRAFLARPSIVLADELSMGLAPVVVDRIFDALAELRARGTAMLVVEQYVDRILHLADYVYVLHKGEMVFAGSAERAHDLPIFEQYLGGAA